MGVFRCSRPPHNLCVYRERRLGLARNRYRVMVPGRDLAAFDNEFAKAFHQRLHRDETARFERIYDSRLLSFSQRWPPLSWSLTDQGRIGA